MGATVTTVSLEGWRRAKHIDGGKMCDGWPAGPAPSGRLSRCSPTSERDHLARVRFDLGAVRSPGVHQLAPLLEQVAASVGRLHRVGDGVCERHLRDLAREVRALGRPVTEGRTETV